MKIDKVRLQGADTIDLPISTAVPSSKYLVTNIAGLEPPMMSLKMFRSVSDVYNYQGRKVDNRVLVIRIKLQPNYGGGETAESLRERLYRLMHSISSVAPSMSERDKLDVLLYLGDTVVSTTKGFISKIEAVPFSADPEVQLTIECASPYLESPDVTRLQGFPSTAVADLNVPGSAETGFYGEWLFSAAAPKFKLGVSPSFAGPLINIDYDFAAGDRLKLNTRPGERSVRVLRAATNGHRDLVGYLTVDSSWFLLRPGQNTLYFGAPQGFDASYFFDIKARYLGV